MRPGATRCALALVLLASGCASSTYRSAAVGRPMARVVSVMGSMPDGADGGRRSLGFATLDGRSLANNFLIGLPGAVDVAPGRHTADMSYWHRTLSVSTHVQFDVVAGHSYQLRERNSGHGVAYYLADDATGVEIRL